MHLEMSLPTGTLCWNGFFYQSMTKLILHTLKFFMVHVMNNGHWECERTVGMWGSFQNHSGNGTEQNNGIGARL